MNVIEGTGDIIDEPRWSMLLTDELEIEAASEHWRRIRTEMREQGTLAPVNGHAVQRLVIAYILFDRSSREVMESGAVAKPKRGNPKAIARVSPHFTAMREAASDAANMEAELGIAPRRRSSAGKVQRKKAVSRPADSYLKPVGR